MEVDIRINNMISIKDLAEHYDYTCCYCSKKFKLKELSREHLLAKSLGGSNNVKNIRLACRQCNSIVGNLEVAIKLSLMTAFQGEIPKDFELRYTKKVHKKIATIDLRNSNFIPDHAKAILKNL